MPDGGGRDRPRGSPCRAQTDREDQVGADARNLLRQLFLRLVRSS